MFEIGFMRRLFMHAGHAAHAGRHHRAAVIAIVAPDDNALFGPAFKRPEMPHHADDGVVRLRPGIGIEDVTQTIRRDAGEPRRQLGDGPIAGLEEVVVIGQLGHLAGGRLDKLLPAIADIHAPQTGHPIKDAVALAVMDVMPVGMGDNPCAMLTKLGIIGKGRHVMRRIQRLPFAGRKVFECHVSTIQGFIGLDSCASA